MSAVAQCLQRSLALCLWTQSPRDPPFNVYSLAIAQHPQIWTPFLPFCWVGEAVVVVVGGRRSWGGGREAFGTASVKRSDQSERGGRPALTSVSS